RRTSARSSSTSGVEDVERAQATFEVVFHRRDRQRLDLRRRDRRRLGQRGAELAAEDQLQQPDRFGRDAAAAAVLPAQETAFLDVEGAQAVCLSADAPRAD